MEKIKKGLSKEYKEFNSILKKISEDKGNSIFFDNDPLELEEFCNLESEEKLEFIDKYFLWISQEKVFLLKKMNDDSADYVQIILDRYLDKILEIETGIIKELIDENYSELRILDFLEIANSHLPLDSEIKNFESLKNHFRFIKKQLVIYQKLKVDIINSYSESVISLDNISHKILLLDEIGIIEFIKKKYKKELENNTELAKFLAGIMNVNDAKEIYNISRILSRINTNSKKKPENKTSIKVIKSELAKFGIEIEKFKAYLD